MQEFSRKDKMNENKINFYNSFSVNKKSTPCSLWSDGEEINTNNSHKKNESRIFQDKINLVFFLNLLNLNFAQLFDMWNYQIFHVSKLNFKLDFKNEFNKALNRISSKF